LARPHGNFFFRLQGNITYDRLSDERPHGEMVSRFPFLPPSRLIDALGTSGKGSTLPSFLFLLPPFEQWLHAPLVKIHCPSNVLFCPRTIFFVILRDDFWLPFLGDFIRVLLCKKAAFADSPFYLSFSAFLRACHDPP